MKNEDVDKRLRELLLDSLDKAYEFAVESRSVEALGGVATLAAKCIDWESTDDFDTPVGFAPAVRSEDE